MNLCLQKCDHESFYSKFVATTQISISDFIYVNSIRHVLISRHEGRTPQDVYNQQNGEKIMKTVF